MTLLKKLEGAGTVTTCDGTVSVVLTHDELAALINAMRLSDAVWRIAKS